MGCPSVKFCPNQQRQSTEWTLVVTGNRMADLPSNHQCLCHCNEGSVHILQFCIAKFTRECISLVKDMCLEWIQTFADGQRRWPLRSQYIQTDTAVTVYIGMINPRCECHLQLHTTKPAANYDLQLITIKQYLGTTCIMLSCNAYNHGLWYLR